MQMVRSIRVPYPYLPAGTVPCGHGVESYDVYEWRGFVVNRALGRSGDVGTGMYTYCAKSLHAATVVELSR